MDVTQERVINDLKFVFNLFKEKRYKENLTFSENFKESLKENIDPDPNTQDAWSIAQVLDFKIKKRKNKIIAVLNARGDNYWLVGGEPSGEPGQIRKEGILKDAELEYELEYRVDQNGNIVLNKLFGSDGLSVGGYKHYYEEPLGSNAILDSDFANSKYANYVILGYIGFTASLYYFGMPQFGAVFFLFGVAVYMSLLVQIGLVNKVVKIRGGRIKKDTSAIAYWCMLFVYSIMAAILWLKFFETIGLFTI